MRDASVPAELRALIARGVADEPASRPTADELAQALEALACERPRSGLRAVTARARGC